MLMLRELFHLQRGGTSGQAYHFFHCELRADVTIGSMVVVGSMAESNNTLEQERGSQLRLCLTVRTSSPFIAIVVQVR